MEEKREYNGLDCLKCICAFFVVCGHAQFPGAFGKYFVELARTALPFFIMITGFFYSKTEERGRINLQIKKIAVMILSSNLFYLLWNTLINLTEPGAAKAYLASCFSLKGAINLFIFGESPFAEHLWYLSTVLYVLLIIKLADKLFGRQKLYPLVPVLIVCGLCLGKYSVAIFGSDFSFVYTRNFLFIGLPCFLLGDMLWRYKDKISQIHNSHKNLFAILIAAFAAATVFERFTVVSLGIYASGAYNISTIPLAAALFMYALNLECKGRVAGSMAVIGRRYSGMIYLCHPVFVRLLNMLVNSGRLPSALYKCLSATAPFIVFALALAFSIGFNYISTQKKKLNLK